MPDELVNVRYMVDDVESRRRLLHHPLRLHRALQRRARVRRRRARQPAAAAQRPDELGRAADARRPHTRAGRLEPHPLHRRATSTAEVERLRAAGLTFRNDIVSGPGGQQILLEDPAGNPIELFQPAGVVSTVPNVRTDVLLRGEETGGQLSVTEIVVPPHTAGPPLHTHDFDEAFYMLEGELIFQVEDALVDQGRGRDSLSPRATSPTRSPTTATRPRATCSSVRPGGLRAPLGAHGRRGGRGRAPGVGAAADPRGHGRRPADHGTRMRLDQPVSTGRGCSSGPTPRTRNPRRWWLPTTRNGCLRNRRRSHRRRADRLPPP